MRRAHYVKANESTKIPHRFLFTDTETGEDKLIDNVSHHKLTMVCSVYTYLDGVSHWVKPSYTFQYSQESYLDYMLSLTQRNKPLHIVAHNLGYDIVSLNLLNLLEADGWKCTQSVIASPPMFFTWRKGLYTIKAIDSMNYFPYSIDTLGKSLGLDKLGEKGKPYPGVSWEEYCRRDVDILMRTMQGWYKFLVDEDLGTPAISLPSQTMKAFRHRFMHHKIFIDVHPVALDIARKSYHGGRVECFATGTYQGSFHKLDINSMYPYVMKEYEYPTKLITVWRNVSLTELQKALQTYCISAHVQVTTDEPVYPLKGAHRLIFPIGTFDAYLSSPELTYALDHNHIQRVYQAALYERAPIFVDYVDFFYAQRQRAKDAGNEMLSTNFKLMLNSFYGKWAQVGRKTIVLDGDPGWKGLTNEEKDLETGRWQLWRKIGGQWRCDSLDGEGMESHPAIAAHVTAYARMYLWSLIRQASIEHCYYCDTDSLIVSDEGLQRLQYLLDANVLGHLKSEGQSSEIVLVNPKHYTFQGVQKLKGIRKDAQWLDGQAVLQQYNRSLKGLLQAGDITHNQWVMIHKTISLLYKKGHVLPSGRTEPYNLPGDLARIDIA